MGYIVKFRLPNLYTIIILTKIKKYFLKKEERVKGFLIFMIMLNKLNLTMVRKSPANEVVVGLLSFLIV